MSLRVILVLATAIVTGMMMSVPDVYAGGKDYKAKCEAKAKKKKIAADKVEKFVADCVAKKTKKAKKEKK